MDGPGATWRSAAARLLRTGGARALFRGVLARTAEMGPLSALGAVGYAAAKRAAARGDAQGA